MSLRKLLLLVLVAVAAGLYFSLDLGRYLSLDTLKTQQAAIETLSLIHI